MAPGEPTSAISSLVDLLETVRNAGGCASTTAAALPEELCAFSQGKQIKQQLYAKRKERLNRLLELAAAPPPPHSNVRRRLGDDSNYEGASPHGLSKVHWSPVSVLDRPAAPCSGTCSTPVSSRSDDSDSAAGLPLTPVPCALDTRQHMGPTAAARGGPKPAPPPPPLPPPPNVLRLGVQVMPPTPLNIRSPLVSPRGRVPLSAAPHKPAVQQAAGATPGTAAPPPPPPLPPRRLSGGKLAAPAPPPPPPPLPAAARKVAGGAPPPPPPPPPPPGRLNLPRLAVPEPGGGTAAGTGRTPPPPPRQPGPLPAHLAAPAPGEGVQRRPIHFDGVRPLAAQGSLWEAPPPEQAAASPAEAVRVEALDRLFAKSTLAPAEAERSTAGSPSGSPQRLNTPTAEAGRSRCGSGGPFGSSGDGSSGDLERTWRWTASKLPIIRIFTGGRKAVNIEILLRQLGRPADVAQAIAELDTSRLQVAILRELQANMPDSTELAALHAFLDAGGNPSQLGKAEQLFVGLRGVARLEEKLQVLAFKGGLQEAAGEVTEPLSRILAALDELRGSDQLRLLLHTALRLGNALNAGRKAPQRGIRLAHLRKLADTKSLDGRTTLMHYLAALMLESAPGALLLGKAGSQCGAVPEARHWSFAELEAQLDRISTGIDMVRREQAAAHGGEQRQLAALAGQAGALMQRAAQLLATARQKAGNTLRYLGDEVAAEPAFSATEPRRMLSDVGDFLALLHKAHADGGRMEVCIETLRQQREAEQRAAAEAAAAEAAAKQEAEEAAEKQETAEAAEAAEQQPEGKAALEQQQHEGSG
ncbi:hypothetical protein D9Q98_005060 [Chlorella vulgaris]|uniref:Formin-like protein n=1 Tax=Chlorella vulgaris TaxID=3077 RepID=A0A9D4YWL9_CHLVU|nr:hypothetical protein D9Q98_005060 [Chlorella vulgaris]